MTVTKILSMQFLFGEFCSCKTSQIHLLFLTWRPCHYFDIRRQPFYQNSYDCLVRIFSNGDEHCISSAFVTDVVYILRKYIADKAVLFYSVENFMDLVAVLDTKYSTANTAFSFALKDYEDAVVLQSAIENGVSVIISKNKNDFINTPISVLFQMNFCNNINCALLSN